MAEPAKNASGYAASFADIEAAAAALVGQVVRTPLIAAPKLSNLTGAEVFVKYENLQFTPTSISSRG